MTLGNDNGTDGQTDRRTDRVRRNMRPSPREEGRIIMWENEVCVFKRLNIAPALPISSADVCLNL